MPQKILSTYRGFNLTVIILYGLVRKLLVVSDDFVAIFEKRNYLPWKFQNQQLYVTRSEDFRFSIFLHFWFLIDFTRTNIMSEVLLSWFLKKFLCHIQGLAPKSNFPPLLLLLQGWVQFECRTQYIQFVYCTKPHKMITVSLNTL